MRKYFFIGNAGFFGAVLRFYIKGVQAGGYKFNIPLNTLFVNITGSFLLALVLVLALETCKIGENTRLGISVGFLGAYTTFSTLCKELAALIWDGLYYSAFLYAAASILLGLLAVFCGIAFAKKISKVINDRCLRDASKYKGSVSDKQNWRGR